MAKTILSDFVRLIREFGIGFLIITQTLKDLDHTVLANTSKKILVGGLGSGIDYQIFGSSIGLPYEKLEFLKKRTLPGQACVFDYKVSGPFTMTIPYMPFNKNITDSLIDKRFKQFEDLIYEKPVPNEQSSGQETQKEGSSEERPVKAGPKISSEAETLLRLKNTIPNCFLSQGQTFHLVGIKGGAKMKSLKSELLKSQWIREHYLQVGKARVCFWEVAERARTDFDLPELKLRGKGGFIHQLVGYYVSIWARENGYDFKLEPQIGRNSKAVDVLLAKDSEVIIMEFCMSEPVSKELSNVVKDFDSGFKFSKLVVLCRDGKMRKKLEKTIADDLIASQYRDRIEVKLAGDYINLKRG